jgi:hypothetical protein
MARGTSKNAQRFRLDFLAKHWMEAGPRHHVGFRPKDLTHPFLDVDEVDKAKSGIIGIEEEVNITVRLRVTPSNRAEQIEPRHAGAMKIGFMGA